MTSRYSRVWVARSDSPMENEWGRDWDFLMVPVGTVQYRVGEWRRIVIKNANLQMTMMHSMSNGQHDGHHSRLLAARLGSLMENGTLAMPWGSRFDNKHLQTTMHHSNIPFRHLLMNSHLRCCNNTRKCVHQPQLGHRHTRRFLNLTRPSRRRCTVFPLDHRLVGSVEG